MTVVVPMSVTGERNFTMLTVEEKDFVLNNIFNPIWNLNFFGWYWIRGGWWHREWKPGYNGRDVLWIRTGKVLYHLERNYEKFTRIGTEEERKDLEHILDVRLFVVSPPDADVIVCKGEDSSETMKAVLPMSKLSRWRKFFVWWKLMALPSYGRLIEVTNQEGPWWDEMRKGWPSALSELSKFQERHKSREREEAQERQMELNEARAVIES